MEMRQTIFAISAVVIAAILAMLGAWWSAVAIEQRSARAVTSRLMTEGITWASVDANGLQIHLTGTAPNEAARFRVVNLVGSVVQAARIRDDLDVTALRGVEAPRFSVEMLRNDDGVSLIGLLPGTTYEETITQSVTSASQGLEISDMLETADYPAPKGWDAALTFGLEAMAMLPRSKISVAADLVTITAISASAEEKRKLEADLRGRVPKGLEVTMDISAPRPVLTPFTLRFVLDQGGARFDACSADTERTRDRILAAGAKAGSSLNSPCTIGLGVPTKRWADAAEAGIRAVSELGAGTITFSDADVSLMASAETPQEVFDRVVGDLQAQLPPVFSLQSTLAAKASAQPQGPAEFTAKLDATGQVELRGRLTDEMLRDAVDSFARAQFGVDRVYTATRMDDALPDGWPVRVLAGLESLAVLHHGTLKVTASDVEIAGVTGNPDGKARIAQILSDKLGKGKTFSVSVNYDKELDPLAALPTPQECAADMNAVLARHKITFSPGSAEIDGDARSVIDALAEVLKKCPPLEMEVAGHTDSQGSEGGNRALSQARAEAVLTALQGRRLRVEAFRAVGYGEANPIAGNDSEVGREANRRIEFTLLSEPVETPPPSPVDAAKAAVAAAQTADAPAPAEEAPQAGETSGDTAPDAAAATNEETLVFEPSDEKSPRPKTRP